MYMHTTSMDFYPNADFVSINSNEKHSAANSFSYFHQFKNYKKYDCPIPTVETKCKICIWRKYQSHIILTVSLKLGWTNLSCKKLHTTVFRLIRVIQTVLFSVTFPDFRDAPIVCDSTPELASAAVSYTSFQIHTQQKVIWAVTGVVLTPRSNQTQVRASPIVVPTWINT